MTEVIREVLLGKCGKIPDYGSRKLLLACAEIFRILDIPVF